MKQILIVYPSSSPENPKGDTEFEVYKSVPIGILSIGAFMEEKGYKVKIIDGRLYSKKDVIKKVKNELNNSLCVGFSVTTPQIKHALDVSDLIKKINDKIPVVWGGIHPTLFPEQTYKDKSVDYVIYGEGEYSFWKLIEYFNNKKTKLDDINGLVYKKKGKVVINKLAYPVDPNNLPMPAYHLLDIEHYINREFHTDLGGIKKMRALDICTSRGCPYRCTFCTNQLPMFKRWRPIEVNKVLREIDCLVKKYKLNHIWFMDDFLFGDKERVKKITEYLIKKKYNLTWEGNIRVNLFNKNQVNDKLLKLLKKSGCFALRMGMESGSDRILKLIKKDITANQIIHAVKQCEKHGIIPVGNFMCGFPFETKEDVIKTAKLILKLKGISPSGLFFSPGLLRPYPGAELYEECVAKGFKAPKTLREWANKRIDVGLYVAPEDLPWIRNPKWVLNFQVYFYILLVLKSHELTKTKISFVWKLFAKIAEFRLKHDLWLFSIEPPLLIKSKKFLNKGSTLAEFTKKILGL
jgi:radical SAM superfamily enzyme YgiQ (UPF0313 family)